MEKQVDANIATAPALGQPHLRAIRQLAIKLCPKAEEVLSYKIPALKQGRVFFFYAAFKTHIGIYPPLPANTALLAELAPYLGPKGNLAFKYSDEMPMTLIAKVIGELHSAYAVKDL